MKTYKTLNNLWKRLRANEGKKVNTWNDEGIKVSGKVFKLKEYGNMGYNFTGNEYVIFENKKKGQIFIEYKLLKKSPKSRSNNLFHYVELSEVKA